MQLTLILPELLWPEPEDHETLDALDCPALTTLLARSRRTQRPPLSFEATLTDTFGHPEGVPYAAFRLLGESKKPLEASESHWLCSDPVHLRFHQDLLVLADSGSFDISLEEASVLAGALNDQLSGIGRLHVASADRWYLQLSDSTVLENFDVPPLSSVAGRSIEGLLPETASFRTFHKLFTEAQMVLHAHPVNQKRESENRQTINGLWLWGAGKLPPRRETEFDGVWSANPLALGLARAAGVPTHPEPVDAATVLEHAAPGTQQLVVLEDLLGAVQYENGEDYRTALSSLESRWFAPLRAALLTGKIKQLTIESSTAYAALVWKSRRRDQWKVWQRPQPLASLAKALAKGPA